MCLVPPFPCDVMFHHGKEREVLFCSRRYFFYLSMDVGIDVSYLVGHSFSSLVFKSQSLNLNCFNVPLF